MSITGILVILGCLAAGYWIVASVMGDGIDVTRQDKAAPPRDWHLELDVTAEATRAEIEAALKRRLAQAKQSGDHEAMARIRQAAADGLQHARRSRRGGVS
jgi:(p)ppGpp synthase/HD superfamily hydrolase